MSLQLYEELLKDLKKSNKVRRLKLAEKSGFDTVEAYQKYLQAKIAVLFKKGTSTKAPTEKEEKKSKGTKKSTPKVDDELVDIVIAFDTTGSMGAYIQQVRNHVSTLIPEFLQNPNLKLSIVAFGDYCDMESPDVFGNAYQAMELTDIEQSLINFVKNAKDTGGCDSDEFYELVIKKVTEETNWREGSEKTVLLIADAHPHYLGYTHTNLQGPNKIDWKEEAEKSAKLGIKWDTLKIRSHSFHSWYDDLSQITGGVSLNFQSAGKTDQLLRATVSARGGSSARASFVASASSKEVLEDAEMSAVYSTYSKEIIK